MIVKNLRCLAARQLAKVFRRVMDRRKPDFVIGASDNPYLLRWWILPRNKWFNCYLHLFLRSDDAEALHDHPWWNVSFLLDGTYTEHIPLHKVLNADGKIELMTFDEAMRYCRKSFAQAEYQGIDYYHTYTRDRWPGDLVYRPAMAAHRVELRKLWTGGASPAMSLFFTGPKSRKWGFHTKLCGWLPWEQFIAQRPDGNDRGGGADECT